MKLLKYCPYCTRSLSFTSIIRQRLFAKDKEAITCEKCNSVISTSGAAKVLPTITELMLSAGVTTAGRVTNSMIDNIGIPFIQYIGFPYDPLIYFVMFIVIFLLLIYYLAPIRSS